MRAKAIVYCENEFGKIDGKVANGLARHSEKYEIVGIVDSTKEGLDAGEHLDGIKNGIPIFKNIDEAIRLLSHVPDFFIYGIAPLTPLLGEEDREVIFHAIKLGMDIVNGMPEFLTEDGAFMQAASTYGVNIYDIRKPPKRKDLHNFSGRILDVKTPVVAVLGTDCAVGKRTTAINLVDALRLTGLKVEFIATGQTGLLQGSKYGVAVDVLSSGYASGEVENEIVKAYEIDNPDIIIVEGQGAMSHPAFTSSCAILRGAMPDAVIMQHPPKRRNHCDYPDFPMPTLENEIKLVKEFSGSDVIAITINHENMSDLDLNNCVVEYENLYKLPVTDVLKHGCDKLVNQLFNTFPTLLKAKTLVWQPLD